MNRDTLFAAGRAHAAAFCKRNGLRMPLVTAVTWVPHSATCAYYRRGCIYVCVPLCAAPAPVQRCRLWSYPAYRVDRTPYGVVMHELGHHVDSVLGHASNSAAWHAACKGSRVTGYEPNVSEKFAESFRLFTTNPALLRAVAPLRHAHLVALGLHSTAPATWRAALAAFNAPQRFVDAAANLTGE
jgi:hypothetical protein